MFCKAHYAFILISLFSRWLATWLMVLFLEFSINILWQSQCNKRLSVKLLKAPRCFVEGAADMLSSAKFLHMWKRTEIWMVSLWGGLQYEEVQRSHVTVKPFLFGSQLTYMLNLMPSVDWLRSLVGFSVSFVLHIWLKPHFNGINREHRVTWKITTDVQVWCSRWDLLASVVASYRHNYY